MPFLWQPHLSTSRYLILDLAKLMPVSQISFFPFQFFFAISMHITTLNAVGAKSRNRICKVYLRRHNEVV